MSNPRHYIQHNLEQVCKHDLELLSLELSLGSPRRWLETLAKNIQVLLDAMTQTELTIAFRGEFARLQREMARRDVDARRAQLRVLS